MKKSIVKDQVKIKIINTISDELMRKVITYFKHSDADLIQFDDYGNLDIKLSNSVADEILLYIFVQDLEYLVGKPLTSSYMNHCIIFKF